MNAADLLRTPQQIRIMVGLCWLGWVFDFYDLILIAFILPSIEKSLGIDPQMSAWLMGVGLGATGLGGILFGWLADQHGRKPILTVTVILFSIGMLLSGLCQTPEQFIWARLITGLGLGGEWAVGHALVSESVAPEARARWAGWLQSGSTVGVVLAAIVGFLIEPQVGWRTVLIASSLIGFLAFAFRPLIHESPIWLVTPKQTSGERLRLLPTFFRDYGKLLLMGFILATFKLGTYWTCYTWLPRFVQKSFGTEMEKSVLWITLGQLGQFIGLISFGAIADKIGKRWGFSLFSSITIIALLPLAFLWDLLFHQAQVLFWVLIFVLGLGSGCTSGFGPLLAEIFPKTHRTFAMGTVYNSARGVQLFAPVVVGMAVERWGITGGLMIPAILALLTGLWVWLLPDKAGSSLDFA